MTSVLKLPQISIGLRATSIGHICKHGINGNDNGVRFAFSFKLQISIILTINRTVDIYKRIATTIIRIMKLNFGTLQHGEIINYLK